ncbi:hypothetical protein QBC46DRAFT_316934 [Diplogelasinospora grovesii]|uniref:Ysc84 actin-binding domain-containing protein n=1 Tax=Diplogelasinospora grovesii TaxID=303347 RepID=A0AAN6N6W0_9PEZI|nr:hypothetical protein QBC46DRAFT_316934 [Diplogelasinospora grovesii]
MSDKAPINPAAQKEQYFPPPPPGPPPGHASSAHAPQHPNETPIPDYSIPTYNPAHPQYAPPPATAQEDLYDVSPTGAKPPQFPETSAHHQEHHQDGETKTKASWTQRLSGLGAKAAAPINALAHKMGSEAFLPSTMDKECEKAARILRSFCKDGIYSDAAPQTLPAQTTVPPSSTQPSVTDAHPAPVSEKPTDKQRPKQKVLLTIPSKVIARAQGLAIFTTVRAGFQVTGASGSGILIARLPDGSWSPPSGIQVHSIGAGFVVGLDIYDCVVVINTKEALEAFTKTRMSLGSDLAVTAGPWGAGGGLDWGIPQSEKGKEKEKHDRLAPPTEQTQPTVTTGPEVTATPAVSTPADGPPGSSKNRKPSPFREAIKKPVYSYVKSRGFYAGVQIDGTVVTERKDANAAFYGQVISVEKILKGEVPTAHGTAANHMWPAGAKGLFETLKGAEGWRGRRQSPTRTYQQGFGHQQGAPGAQQAAPYGQSVGTGHHAPQPAPAPSASIGVPSVTQGMQGMNLGAGNYSAGPSTAAAGAGAPAPPTAAAQAKAAEAAAEAQSVAQAHDPSISAPPPPSYTAFDAQQPDAQYPGQPTYHNPTGASDLPPAYVDDGQVRPGVGDSKTGHQ